MIRLLIVAAYSSVRTGLHALLADADVLSIVGEVSGSGELERLIPEVEPDVVLIDDNPADFGQLLAVLQDRGTGLVVLGDQPDGYRGLARRSSGGWGYLLKDADGPAIQAAIQAAASGLIALDARVDLPRDSLSTADASLASGGVRGETLTRREQEVLELMAQGLPNKIIAARLEISLHTVKFHVASILAKLGASSRTEAVTLGARRGYIAL